MEKMYLYIIDICHKTHGKCTYTKLLPTEVEHTNVQKFIMLE